MGGSRKWMDYKADNNSLYAVQVDESNGILTGFVDYGGDANTGYLPKLAKMRAIDVLDPVSGARRRLPVGDPADDVWTGAVSILLLPLLGPGGTAAALTAFQIVNKISEDWPQGFDADTGLTDGTAD